MKKLFYAGFFLLFFNTAFAQLDLMGGMGISFISTPAFQDYINNIGSGGDKVSSFNSAAAFYFEGDYLINPTFSVGLEYENRLYSFTAPLGGLGNYDISYNVHSPTILAYYVIAGTGYQFKFGGGAGYRFISLDEKFPSSQNKDNYTSSGFGGVLKAQGHTSLGGDFYAYIGADIRYDLIGEASGNDGTLQSEALNEKIDFNTFGVGVKIGISYFIR